MEVDTNAGKNLFTVKEMQHKDYEIWMSQDNNMNMVQIKVTTTKDQQVHNVIQVLVDMVRVLSMWHAMICGCYSLAQCQNPCLLSVWLLVAPFLEVLSLAYFYMECYP